MKVGRGTNEPTSINGRRYSGHALDEMQSDGIGPSVVENTILHGDPTIGPSTTRYYDADNNVSVLLDNASGTVVTVTRGKLGSPR